MCSSLELISNSLENSLFSLPLHSLRICWDPHPARAGTQGSGSWLFGISGSSNPRHVSPKTAPPSAQKPVKTPDFLGEVFGASPRQGRGPRSPGGTPGIWNAALPGRTRHRGEAAVVPSRGEVTPDNSWKQPKEYGWETSGKRRRVTSAPPAPAALRGRASHRRSSAPADAARTLPAELLSDPKLSLQRGHLLVLFLPNTLWAKWHQESPG